MDEELARLKRLTEQSSTYDVAGVDMGTEHDTAQTMVEEPATTAPQGEGLNTSAADAAAGAASNEANPPSAAPDAAQGDTGDVPEDDDELIKRSIYVGNVDYGTTPEELQRHFAKCGRICRITIMVDKFTGHPKGFAYLEFADEAAANSALMLANTTLRGRPIKVLRKRRNIAGMSARGARGRGMMRGRGAMYPMYAMPYGPTPGMKKSALLKPRGSAPY